MENAISCVRLALKSLYQGLERGESCLLAMHVHPDVMAGSRSRPRAHSFCTRLAF
jgi:hypothetical protein